MTLQVTPARFDYEQVLCQSHREAFREAWPRGAAAFRAGALDYLHADGRLAAECKGKVENLEKLLWQRPMCCLLRRSELLSLYMATVSWRTGKCQLCRKSGPGTKYQGTGVNGSIKRKQHVCLRCFTTIGEQSWTN